MLAAADPADLDDGPRTAKSGSERMCAVTRQVRSTGDLIRFVVSPDGEVLADLKRKLPGRGLWLSASRDILAEAVRRGVFSRGFKRNVRVSPELVAQTEILLIRAVVDALAIAAKAGAVVAGFAKVDAALRAGEAMALLHASDGASDGIRKLNAVAGQVRRDDDDLPTFAVLTSAQLDLALGRSNVIHAALRADPAAKTVVVRSRGVVRFRDGADQGVAKASGHTGHLTQTADRAKLNRPNDLLDR